MATGARVQSMARYSACPLPSRAHGHQGVVSVPGEPQQAIRDRRGYRHEPAALPSVRRYRRPAARPLPPRRRRGRSFRRHIWGRLCCRTAEHNARAAVESPMCHRGFFPSVALLRRSGAKCETHSTRHLVSAAPLPPRLCRCAVAQPEGPGNCPLTSRPKGLGRSTCAPPPAPLRARRGAAAVVALPRAAVVRSCLTAEPCRVGLA